FKFVEDGAQNHGTGGAERVAHGDGSAVDVDLLMRNAQVTHPLEYDGGEGLVEFEQVDVVDGEAGFVEGLARRRSRTGEHDRRFGTGDCGGDDAGTRFHAHRLAHLGVAEDDQAGAVDDARGVRGGVDVVDL